MVCEPQNFTYILTNCLQEDKQLKHNTWPTLRLCITNNLKNFSALKALSFMVCAYCEHIHTCVLLYYILLLFICKGPLTIIRHFTH